MVHPCRRQGKSQLPPQFDKILSKSIYNVLYIEFKINVNAVRDFSVHIAVWFSIWSFSRDKSEAQHALQQDLSGGLPAHPHPPAEETPPNRRRFCVWRS
jgi:hypothetical protein